MANGNGRGHAVFLPSAARAGERASSAIVGRLAAPVAAIGSRVLGFVDRLLGPRLLAATAANPWTQRAQASATGTSWAVPWYESSTPESAPATTGRSGAAPRRQVMTVTVPGRPASGNLAVVDRVFASPVP